MTKEQAEQFYRSAPPEIRAMLETLARGVERAVSKFQPTDDRQAAEVSAESHEAAR